MRGGSITGGFILGGVIIADFEDREDEIDPCRVLQGYDRAIENFIQRKTDDNLFDLLRAGTERGKVEEGSLTLSLGRLSQRRILA